MPLTVDTAPDQMPVDLDELKDHLNMEGTTRYDAYLNLLISAFADVAGEELGQQLIKATRIWTMKEWKQEVELPRPPLMSVTTVEYRDSDGNWLTVDASNYETNKDAKPGFVRFNNDYTAPETYENEKYPWRYTYDCGHYDSNSPADSYKKINPKLRVWMMNLIGTQFMKREADIISTDSVDVQALKAQMARLIRGENFNVRFG